MTVSTLPSGWIVSCSFGSSLTAQIGENVAEPGSEWPLLRQWVGRLFARSTPRRPMGPWNPYNPRDRPHWGFKNCQQSPALGWSGGRAVTIKKSRCPRFRAPRDCPRTTLGPDRNASTAVRPAPASNATQN
jgi:hypothetical protein